MPLLEHGEPSNAAVDQSPKAAHEPEGPPELTRTGIESDHGRTQALKATRGLDRRSTGPGSSLACYSVLGSWCSRMLGQPWTWLARPGNSLGAGGIDFTFMAAACRSSAINFWFLVNHRKRTSSGALTSRSGRMAFLEIQSLLKIIIGRSPFNGSGTMP